MICAMRNHFSLACLFIIVLVPFFLEWSSCGEPSKPCIGANCGQADQGVVGTYIGNSSTIHGNVVDTVIVSAPGNVQPYNLFFKAENVNVTSALPSPTPIFSTTPLSSQFQVFAQKNAWGGNIDSVFGSGNLTFVFDSTVSVYPDGVISANLDLVITEVGQGKVVGTILFSGVKH